MNAINVQIAAIFTLSIANTVMLAQNVRWILLNNDVRTMMPESGLLDLFLDLVPALLIALAAGYFLLYQLSYNIWRYRNSIFREDLMARALMVNSILLILLIVLGIVQWIVLSSFITPDLFVMGVVGVVAAYMSFHLDRRLKRR